MNPESDLIRRLFCSQCGLAFLPLVHERLPGPQTCLRCGSREISETRARTVADIVNAPLTAQEQRGKDMVERLKQQKPEKPAPLVADEDWFDREERAAMQAEGMS